MAYYVGGFFGKIWKGIKKVAHVVGKVGGTALGVASIVVPGPAGRVVAAVSGKLAGVKSAAQRLNRDIHRYQPKGVPVLRTPGFLNKVSPIMPGGSPATVGGTHGPTSSRRRRKRKASRKRSSHATARGGRKLKFGSKAWRAKYMKRGR